MHSNDRLGSDAVVANKPAHEKRACELDKRPTSVFGGSLNY